MEYLGRVKVLERLNTLIDYVALVNVLEDIGLDHLVQITVQKLKYQVDVFVVLGLQHVEETNYVIVI